MTSTTSLILRYLRWSVVVLFFAHCLHAEDGGGQFEVLGVPVKTVGFMGTVIGIDKKTNEVIYFNCAQPGGRLFLLQVNPKTGETHQFDAPIGEGARDIIVGPDQCVYVGTWESGYLLKFDPRQPEKGLVSLGKPSATETYIWEFAAGSDGRIYGCTYPQAKLVRYDCKTGQSEDLGRLDDSEMYGRWIASSKNGSLYIGIGTVRGQLVRFDPATGKSTRLLKEEERPRGTVYILRAEDGEVYARIGGKAFRCDGDSLKPIAKMPERPSWKLHDGRAFADAKAFNEKIIYTLATVNGQKGTKGSHFQGNRHSHFCGGSWPGREYLWKHRPAIGGV